VVGDSRQTCRHRRMASPFMRTLLEKRAAQKIADKRYRIAHPERRPKGGPTKPETSRKFYEQRRAMLRAAKDKPCADCRIKYPYWIMDFDHRPGEVKQFEVSRSWHSKAAMELEISKCDVVCSNCHRNRTEQRRKQ